MSENAISGAKRRGSVTDLLTDDITHDGWTFSIGQTRSFYIRGATWFHVNVLRNVTELSKFQPQLDNYEAEMREKSPEWLVSGFDWHKRFSVRRAVAGLSLRRRMPLTFEKAVKTLYVCELAALDAQQERGAEVSPSAIYSNMRIEPAVFYIRDFDESKLAELKRANPKILDELRDATGQISRRVLEEMSLGHTVTRDLAVRIRAALLETQNSVSIGSVDFRYRGGQRSATRSQSLLVSYYWPPDDYPT